jgi:hypothetical protein
MEKTGHDSEGSFSPRHTGHSWDEDSSTQVNATDRGAGKDSTEDHQILPGAEIDGCLDYHPTRGTRFL